MNILNVKMSTSASSESPPPTNSSPPDKKQFAEQLLILQRQQEEQYILLTQQYKKQQDMLHERQQQELKQHYTRQLILNPNHKIQPPPITKDPYLYQRQFNDRKVEYEDYKPSMIADVHTTGSSTSSSGLSANVRDKLRRKAIENINKKTAFEGVNPASFVARQDNYNTWLQKQRHYDSRPAPRAPPHSEDENLIPLRKAASEPVIASEPHMKVRNPYKHRVRTRPLTENPLAQTHPRHNYSPETRYADRREAISPPYSRPIEGKVFSQGPKGVPPLFQSPSLPNINLGSSRSQMHFPPPSSSVVGVAGYTNGTSDTKAPYQPGHPKYLDMLKQQYATNHRYLEHIMLEHGEDPKKIDFFHSKYLSKDDDKYLSDEDRVKHLLESQNKLYLRLVETYRLDSPFEASSSKSYSKLHSIENVSPPSSLLQSRSHDSLHSIRSPPSHKDDYFSSHAWHTQNYRHFHREPYHLPASNNDIHMRDFSQPARLRLKEHLYEKYDQSMHSAGKQMAMDAHFQRLEREREQSGKIQEETEEDVRKEEQKNIENSSDMKSYHETKRVPELRPMNGSYGHLHGSNSSLNDHNTRLIGSNSRLHSSNPHLRGSDPRLYGSNPRLYGSDSRLGSNPRLSGSSTRLSDSDPRIRVPASYGSGENVAVISRSTKDMTGIVYDTIMLKHQCSCGGSYPEHPESSGRLQSIWARLHETGVANMCERIRPRKATIAELQTVHSEQHTLLFGGGSSNRNSQNLRCFRKLACGGIGVDEDTVWNETHTSNAARMAAGCVIELGFKVASGELKNGFAIVRPPGHHADAHQAMGFCFFNSVAITAKLLCMKLSVERILILDWDVHHGNGTQQMFYDDDRVLFLSMHRHDNTSFFPGTGKAEECGAGIGVGCNINIPFNGGTEPSFGDPEYLAAFRTVVLPVVKEYKPDIILVSAGFDAANGHSSQLGGYSVTPACFAYMTKQLMNYANGKVVLALEGGYVLQSLCDCVENCIRALLGQPHAELSQETLQKKPNENAIASLEKVIEIQGKYWSGVKRAAPLLVSSQSGAKKMEKEEADTVTALASLSMQGVVKQKSGNQGDEPMDEN